LTRCSTLPYTVGSSTDVEMLGKGAYAVGLAPHEVRLLRVCRALSDPTRLRLVQTLLRREEIACAELQNLFPLSRPALSHHTRVLAECGLLEVRKEGAFHFFRLRREELEKLLSPALLAAAD